MVHGGDFAKMILKSMLEAELVLQIGQILFFLDKAGKIDTAVRDEIQLALEHLYKAKKLLKLDEVN
jgi:hypothetical protein